MKTYGWFSNLTGILAAAAAALAADPAPQASDYPLRAREGEVVPAVKGPNLIANGDFDQQLQGWRVQAAPGTTVQADVVQTDTGPALQVAWTAGEGPVCVFTEPLAVEGGKPYRLTALYHTQSARFGNLAEFSFLQGPTPQSVEKVQTSITQAQPYPVLTHRTMLNAPAGQWKRKTRMITPGKNSRHLRVVLTLEGPPSRIVLDNVHLAPADADQKRPSPPPPQEVGLSREQTLAALQNRPDSWAKVQSVRGIPQLIVDDQPLVPMVHMSDVINPVRGYVSDFAKHHMRLHMVLLFNKTQKHWLGKGKYDLEKLDRLIWNSIERDPTGYFLIGINVLAYDDFHKQFPQDAAQTAGGDYATSRHDDFAPASYYSQEYRDQVYELVRTYVRHINAQPYAKAVVGYFLSGGEDGQFYYQVVAGQKSIQDGQGPGDLPLFRQWLHRRYPTQEELQKAWRDPQVTFDSAKPAVRNQKYPGVFLNPAEHQKEVDHLLFLQDGVAELLAEMSRICKRETDKPLFTGAYYGRGASLSVYPHFAQTRVMFPTPGSLDYIGAQPGYAGQRETGNVGIQAWVYDSTRLHNKIPMQELDYRTWVMQYVSLEHDFSVARYWNVDDFEAAVARELGKNIAVGGGAWFMEMTGGWFRDDTIQQVIQKLQHAGQKIVAASAPVTPASIVLVSDEENILWTTEQINLWNGPNYHSGNLQQQALHRAGVKLDFYYLSDLIDRNLDQYPVYVFLNLYRPTPKARQFIDRLKKSGRILVWQYAPGYLADEGFSTDSMTQLTGLRLQTSPDAVGNLRARLIQQTPKARTPAATLLQGQHGHLMGLGFDLPAPRFWVDDPQAQTLATYEFDGKVAAAVKKVGKSTSIYIGHPSGLTPLLVQNLVRLAGGHVYLEPGDMFMHHRDNFIVLHGVEGGRKNLRFPGKTTVREMLTDRVLGENVRELPLEITPSRTLWLELTTP